MTERNSAGRYTRQRQPWSPGDWDDGFLNNKGRFVVYRPDYPRCWENGYTLRYHVVWWLETGSPVPKGSNLHHRNGDKTDDRLENLELLGHGEHSSLHGRLRGDPWVRFVCEACGEEFFMSQGRVNYRTKQGQQIRFCSQTCYRSVPSSRIHRVEKTCERCGGTFSVIPFHAETRRFCGTRCSALATWASRRVYWY